MRRKKKAKIKDITINTKLSKSCYIIENIIFYILSLILYNAIIGKHLTIKENQKKNLKHKNKSHQPKLEF